jgi:hypothetical protein
VDLGISKPTLDRCRLKLKETGIIDFHSEGKGDTNITYAFGKTIEKLSKKLKDFTSPVTSDITSDFTSGVTSPAEKESKKLKIFTSDVQHNINRNLNIVVEEVEVEIEHEKIGEEAKPEITAEGFFVDEEEKAAALQFLKSNTMYGLIQSQRKITAEETDRLFGIFFEQKTGFKELTGKTRTDVIKNFFYWLPKYQQAQAREGPKQHATGKGDKPSSSRTTQIIESNQKVKDISKKNYEQSNNLSAQA